MHRFLRGHFATGLLPNREMARRLRLPNQHQPSHLPTGGPTGHPLRLSDGKLSLPARRPGQPCAVARVRVRAPFLVYGLRLATIRDRNPH